VTRLPDTEAGVYLRLNWKPNHGNVPLGLLRVHGDVFSGLVWHVADPSGAGSLAWASVR